MQNGQLIFRRCLRCDKMRIPKKKLQTLPLNYLRRLRDYLDVLIGQLEAAPRREIDIAFEHPEDPSRVQVLRVKGDPEKSKSWEQVERVFCDPPCPDCPHGDFFYRYYRRKDGSVRIYYVGKLFLQHEIFEQMRKRITPPLEVLSIEQLRKRVDGGQKYDDDSV